MVAMDAFGSFVFGIVDRLGSWAAAVGTGTVGPLRVDVSSECNVDAAATDD